MRPSILFHVIHAITLTGWWSDAAVIHTSKDLRQAIASTELEQSGCIRLLNANSTVGCASYGSGRLALYDGHLALQGPAVLVADESLLVPLLTELADSDSKYVSGILVVRNTSQPESNLDRKFPQAEFALYPEKSYAWNSKGTSQLLIDRPFSLQYARRSAAASIVNKAKRNSDKVQAQDLHSADMDTSMGGSVDSKTCLDQGRCDPLAGHSVVGWIPNQPDPGPTLPTTLVLAHMDSIGLMHKDIIGAGSALSGLVAMLAGFDLVARHSQQAGMKRRLAFAALAGEPWGFMGSKRLLWQMDQNKSSVQGLALDDIDQIIEIGAVGRMQNTSKNLPRLFIHRQKRSRGFGETSALEKEIIATSAALGSLDTAAASDSNPGLPPSSLSSFLRVKPGIAGVMLTEFDQRYTNPYHASSYDTLEGLNAHGIAQTAFLLAQTLAKSAGQDSIPANSSAALLSKVNELLECVARPGSLLRCSLASRLTTIVGTDSQRVGALWSITKDPQDPQIYIKNDMSRFIWNFLANATSSGVAKTKKGDLTGCNFHTNPCEADAVCVGFFADKADSASNGQCQKATVRFVPSYSTAIQCKDCDGTSLGRWTPSNESQNWSNQYKWPPDPIWTESRWNTGIPSQKIYQAESAQTQRMVLVAGVIVTLLALVVAQFVRRADPRKYQRLSSIISPRQ